MQNLEDYMLPCLNKKMFGIECLGCGLQRSVMLIFQGRFIDAFYMYPAIYTLILLFGLIAVNKFKNFKHASIIIIVLAFVNVAVIIISYIMKTFLIK